MIRIINFPKINDVRGNLTFIQNLDQVPFEIQRIFWTFNVPGGEKRGGHAYFKQEEVIIALNGSFDIVVKKPSTKEDITFHLNNCYTGLYLPPLNWRQIENFSTNAVALHISSSKYVENDYIRDINLINFEKFSR